MRAHPSFSFSPGWFCCGNPPMGDVTPSSPGFIFSTASQPGPAGLSVSKPDDGRRRATPNVRSSVLLATALAAPKSHAVRRHGRTGVTNRKVQLAFPLYRPLVTASGQLSPWPKLISSFLVIGVCFSEWKRTRFRSAAPSPRSNLSSSIPSAVAQSSPIRDDRSSSLRHH